MKKLIIALTATAMAIGAQASKVNWTSASIPYTVNAANVIDNGSYAAGGSEYASANTFTYALDIFTASGDAFDHVEGTVKFSATSDKISTTGIVLNKDLVQGVDYTYVITMAGSSAALKAKPEQEVDGYVYNYSGAQLEAELTGTVTGKSGSAAISDMPTAWTVSGITKTEAPGPGPTPPPIPEPTSGLLLLLGVAGLALRRRRA